MNMIDFDAQAALWDDNPKRLAWSRAVAETLRKKVSLSAGMKAMEYGCGTGVLSILLHPYLKQITLADSSPGMIAVVEEKLTSSGIEGLQPLQLDLMTDALPGARYDLIYSMMALHHIPDTAGILQRFYDIAAPSAYLCLADLDTEDGSFHGMDVDVHHGFDREALSKTLLDAGWMVQSTNTCCEIPRSPQSFSIFLIVARRMDR